jgi:glycosyltransferase involved in cell wall biosynthesis
MNKQSQELILNNLICPISKENLILDNQKVDKNGLVVAVTGPLAPQLKDYINENHLSNLELVGYKSGIELNSIINKASFIVTPSEWYENNPMTIIKGRSYGKPAIGSNIGGIPELINNNQNGFIFHYGDVEALANCIN